MIGDQIHHNHAIGEGTRIIYRRQRESHEWCCSQSHMWWQKRHKKKEKIAQILSYK